MNLKTKICGALVTLGGLVSAAGYAENNTVTNVLNVVYDFVVAIIEQMIPFIPTFIGVGILMFVLGAIGVALASILGFVTILTKFGHKK
jgi:uncharacterized membrane protein